MFCAAVLTGRWSRTAAQLRSELRVRSSATRPSAGLGLNTLRSGFDKGLSSAPVRGLHRSAATTRDGRGSTPGFVSVSAEVLVRNGSDRWWMMLSAQVHPEHQRPTLKSQSSSHGSLLNRLNSRPSTKRSGTARPGTSQTPETLLGCAYFLP